ncbi:uncharacterized protein CANTADRAFT_92426 [Suhomyces tanzawaensis NRRL Y-17324]|uniref:Uncharacterized protein n=1 Tax=Suhomyces tanzawaensis NRRL Y-17324 TaxID=984487 RepID=A0A1E4SBE7_9ASCO|nr:uncharacterized protein CANTADRAFT_92426 [Suhomyces tanzawaensis NRRL Y-17324]ODV76850.1 hypothetical protein CANTADRAFT_92426 [Suhomyces tanzawaensis NRRL Y-17324]
MVKSPIPITGSYQQHANHWPCRRRVSRAATALGVAEVDIEAGQFDFYEEPEQFGQELTNLRSFLVLTAPTAGQ